MLNNLEVGYFILGAILLLIGVIGGNFKIFGTEIASTVSNIYIRILCFIIGILFILFTRFPFSIAPPKLKPEPEVHLPDQLPQATTVSSDPPPHVFTMGEIKEFMDAASNSNLDTIKKYLEFGLNVDTTTTNYVETALIGAVNANKPEAVRLLLEHGANPNIATKINSYPIIEASYGGYAEIVDLLIRHKADVNVVKHDGSQLTSLMFACNVGGHPNPDIVRALINAGANVNARSSPNNSTALDFANELSSPLKEQIISILKDA